MSSEGAGSEEAAAVPQPEGAGAERVESNEPSARRHKSWVWEHVAEVSPSEVRCVHCNKRLQRSGTNTTNIAKHLNNKHRLYEGKRSAPAASTQQVLSFAPIITPNSGLARQIADTVVRLIVHHNLPLSTVEAPEMKELCELLRPKSSEALPSRYALRDTFIPQAAEAKRAKIRN